MKLEIQSSEKNLSVYEMLTETHNSGFKNSNARFEIKSLGSDNQPFRKSVSGYKSSNTTQRASAFKLTDSKCIFCVDETDEQFYNM